MIQRHSRRTWLPVIVGSCAALLTILLLPIFSTSANEDPKRDAGSGDRKDEIGKKNDLHFPGEKQRAELERAREELEQVKDHLAELKNSVARTQASLERAEHRLAQLDKLNDEGSGSGSRSSSPEKCSKEPTRVAAFNMLKVATEYRKTGDIKGGIEKAMKQAEETIKEMQEELKKYEKLPDDPEERDQAIKEARRLKRKLDEVADEKRDLVGKKYAEGEKEIYTDIESAVEKFARARGIDLVFFYNDASDATMKYTPSVLSKRIATSGIPIYCGPGLDISDDIAEILNANYKPADDK
jgi:Skp family chaperone for outer membrane proteins